MSWPPAFVQALSAPSVSLSVIFEVLLPASGEGVGEEWAAASDPRLGIAAQVILSSIRLGPTGVIPQAWQYQAGAFSLELVLPEAGRAWGGRVRGASGVVARNAARALRRGAICRLLIGVAGMTRAEHQPLRLGRLQQVRTRGPHILQVEVWDIVTALRARLNTTDSALSVLFNDNGHTTTLDADYTAGVTSSITLSTASASFFKLMNAGRGIAAIQGGSGNWFLVTFTGTSGGDTLTGVSYYDHSAYSEENAVAGSDIRALVFLEGHPVDIARRLLVSTGSTGSNGDADVYPETWGLGLDQAWIDAPEFARTKLVARIPTPSNYDWEWFFASQVEDPYAWLASQLAQAGLWLCVRQGKIAIRAAHDPALTLGAVAVITDDDLVEGESAEVEWFDGQSPYAYLTFRAFGAVGTDFSRVSTLPLRRYLTANLDQVLNAGITDVEDIATEVAVRLAPWAHFPPEILTLPLAGIQWGFAPGDDVELRLAQLRGRCVSTIGGYSGRMGMVLEETPDLQTLTTRVRIAVLPLDLADDHAA